MDIVKYHNDFNKIQLPSFSEQEHNLLLGIMLRLKEVKRKVVFYQSDFRNILKSEFDNKILGNFMQSLKHKFFSANFSILIQENSSYIDRTINLFSVMEIHFSDKEHTRFEKLVIEVNPRFAYLVNELTANFTRFELAEFIALSGKYTKTLYRLLKQYRNTGYLKMEWSEFLRVMDISDKLAMCDIDKRILKPAIKELIKERNLFDQVRVPFENLKFNKIKGKGRGRGGKVIGIEFYFKKQTELFTKNEQIEFLRKENTELTKELMENNLVKFENLELKEQVEKLEKIAYGIGLKAYCGFKYYSEKNETLKVLDFNEIKNPSDSNRYVAEILNEKTNKSFFLYLESPKHLVNIITRNEKDLFFHNQELIKNRNKS